MSIAQYGKINMNEKFDKLYHLEVSELKSTIATHETKLERMEKDITEIKNDIQEIKKLINKIDAKIDGDQYLQCPVHSEKMSQLEKRLDAYEKQEKENTPKLNKIWTIGLVLFFILNMFASKIADQLFPSTPKPNMTQKP